MRFFMSLYSNILFLLIPLDLRGDEIFVKYNFLNFGEKYFVFQVGWSVFLSLHFSVIFMKSFCKFWISL